MLCFRLLHRCIFSQHKLAIELDEQGHHNRDTVCEIERQKALEKELRCVFIRINPAEENFNVFLKLEKYKITLFNEQRKE